MTIMRPRYLLATTLLCSSLFPPALRAADSEKDEHSCLADRQSEADYAETIDSYLAGPAAATWTAADCRLIGPIWTGDDDKGQLFTPLWHGVTPGIEDWVLPVPQGSPTDLKGTVRIDWDKAADTVTFTIKLHHVPVSPAVRRIDGGDPEITDPADPRHFIPPPQANWWQNKFHNSPKDLPVKPSDGTAYRLWTIFTTFNTRPLPFFYDGQSLMLLGSVLDFPGGPPAGSLAVGIGVAQLVSSSLIYPGADGSAVRQYTVGYNKATTEGGFYGYFVAAFIPHNLCRINPFQPSLGQLRPYASKWQPAAQATSWDVVLRNGLLFDLTVEEGRPDVPAGGNDQNPDYIYGGVSFLSNASSLQGGTPWGWVFNIPGAIQNVQPMLSPAPRLDGFVGNPRVSAPLFCQGQQ
jgi:hypothetical protein